MFNKKLVFSIPLILICLCSWVSSQSLVELAKKEKERRAQIKQKKITVITNADLLKMKRAPAIKMPTVETISPTPGDPLNNEEGPDIESTDSEEPSTIETDEATVAKLEESWNLSEENVSRLVLTMNALLQEFYRTDTTSKKEDIQRQMNEISQQMEAAKKDAEKAKADYDLAKADLEKKKKSLAEINK